MIKRKAKTEKGRPSSAKEPSPAGGEALRRRLKELWKLWNDDLRVRLETPPEGEIEGPFTNLDLLQIVSERDFPDGRQLGEDSWRAYQKARKLEAELSNEIRALRGSAGERRLTKNLSDYGAARELAGYRAAQLEMLVADHAANWNTSSQGSAAKRTKADRRLQLLVAYVRTNSLTLLLPGTIAADADHRAGINSKLSKDFGSIDKKQLERELTKAFAILRATALRPYIRGLERADHVPSVLFEKHRNQLIKQIKVQGISVPSTERQFKEAIERALKTTPL
jgi:hypothetical protein